MVSSSAMGLALCFIPLTVHGTEWLFPFNSLLVVNWILPPFGGVIPPLPAEETLPRSDAVEMLEAARALPCESTKAGKECPQATVAEDYIFILTMEQRQQGANWFAVGLACVYAGLQPLQFRYPLHVLLAALSVCMCLINFGHAGLPLGDNPFVSANGRTLGFVFGFFWLASSILNVLGFLASSEAAQKSDGGGVE
mmetsp:Transcript_6555/g.14288  ORF Transcript_6555/g.14288 Transcript_6555/m.14288 type:complete len:196 (-) Transcript_6555:88-675(-)